MVSDDVVDDEARLPRRNLYTFDLKTPSGCSYQEIQTPAGNSTPMLYALLKYSQNVWCVWVGCPPCTDDATPYVL